MSDKLITFKHQVDGSLADVTSIVLADPTGAFGVRRDDTQALVVVAGTPLIRQSTGVYQYTISDCVAGVGYHYWIEWVYGGVTRRVERSFTAGTSDIANSYLTVDQADALAASLLNLSRYSAASLADKAAALYLASCQIDAAFRYQGRKASPAQERQFPRILDLDYLRHDINGIPYDITPALPAVPQGVLLACLYQAESLLAGSREGRLQAIADGLASQSVGSISESYRSGAIPSVLCARAASLLDPHRLRSGRML